jgi:topoisomerase IV subunit B
MQPRSPDGAIIVALSCDFHVKLCDGKHWTELVCDQGRRVTFRQEPSTSEIGVDLKFAPDCSFFKIVDSSPAVVHSYCRRTSILHAGIAFRVKNGERITEYKSENGIRDFFTAITTPYQMTHEPIHIKEVDGDLAVEVVFVFHSWSENQVWSFANKGRVPDGGTHEAGLLDAISKSCTTPRGSAAGILAVLAIEYPHVTYEGCIKGRIGNPELRDRISEIVLAGIQEWGRENPEEVERYQSVERFQFADIW